MDPATRAFADRLLARGRAHDEMEQDRRRRYRNLERDSAHLLNMLLRSLRPRSVLEIGTSNGYSTLWLADALGGKAQLTTVDCDRGRLAEARANLTRAGLIDGVELVLGGGGEVLAGTASGSVDFLFLDAGRSAYVGYWSDLRRVLAVRGLIVVDNCLSHAGDVAEFRGIVDAEPTVDAVLVPLGAGLLFIQKMK